MKHSVTFSLAVLGIVHLSLQAAPEAGKSADPKEPLRVLLVTGCDVSAHDWRATTPVLREHLEESEKIEVVVSEEPLVLESSALNDYDVVMFNYYNHQRPGLTKKAQENLQKFVASGKGLVSFHFSCRAFGDWPEFGRMIGRIWIGGQSGHGPRGQFDVQVKDKDHFITEGTSDFKADDELYAKLVGDEKIHVLIEAHSDWSGKTEPLAWTLDYEKGRVFNIVLGHDVKAVKDANFGRLLQRGVLWAGRRDGSEKAGRRAGS